MIKKFCFSITASMLLFMTSFSQAIKENIKTQSKNPKTAENAAKADVYILDNKKKITDTTSISSNTDRNSRKKKHSRRKK